MPAKPLTPEQKEDAARLKAAFRAWQRTQRDRGTSVPQLEAAGRLGFGQSALSQYLNGVIPLNGPVLAKFAELIGVSPGSISPSIVEQEEARSLAWASGRLGNLNRIDLQPGTNESAVMAHPLSHPPATVSPSTLEAAMRLIPPAAGYVRLPILAEAAAGPGRDPEGMSAELVEHVDVAEEWVRRTLRANPATLSVLTARGHSMTGQIEDGDVMFVVPCTDFVDDGLYVISVGSLLRVKRLRLRVLDETLSIESNDGSTPETIPLAQADDTLRIAGRVIGAWALRKL